MVTFVSDGRWFRHILRESILQDPPIVNIDPQCAMLQAGQAGADVATTQKNAFGAKRIRNMLTAFGIERREV
jgi:hypothetical protein